MRREGEGERVWLSFKREGWRRENVLGGKDETTHILFRLVSEFFFFFFFSYVKSFFFNSFRIAMKKCVVVVDFDLFLCINGLLVYDCFLTKYEKGGGEGEVALSKLCVKVYFPRRGRG
ncbi:hypothetical protein HMI56_001637 [Coelomomyces lativittatus]|nr:hypothetical protein HMI56_001637 [Coelomomyces lativittatus]